MAREYHKHSPQFATCRQVKTIEPEFSDAVLRWHDECAGVHPASGWRDIFLTSF